MFNLFKSQHAKTISHPQTEEIVLFDQKLIQIEREAFRRRLSLSVALNDEVRIKAAHTTSKSQIRDFLQMQKDWISERLEKNLRLRSRYPQKLYREGETFLFFGREFKLAFEDAAKSVGQIFLRGDSLVVGVPRLSSRNFHPNRSHPELARPIRDFYRHQGRSFIEMKTAELAQKMQLFPKELSFRSQKTRWGSCSSNGNLSFNWRLIIAPQNVIEYVVVHELAHLKHHSHSKIFWELVATARPDYRQLRKWLRDNQFEADFLAKKSELWPM